MSISKIASDLYILFESKITNFYRDSYKGHFGNVQREVLDYMYQNKECRTQEIANSLRISKQHASKIVLRLFEMGLVESKPDTMDKRAVVYSLSEAGKLLVFTHIKESNKHFEEMIQKLTDEERIQLADSMKKMVSLLNKL